MTEGTKILGCPSSEDIMSFQRTLNKSYNNTFLPCFMVVFVLWKLDSPHSLGFHSVEKSSSDIYKIIFPFEDAGEYMMILSICGCTVPLNMH